MRAEPVAAPALVRVTRLFLAVPAGRSPVMGRRPLGAAAALLVALTAGCSAAGNDAVPVGTGVELETSSGVVLTFTVDDVRSGSVADLQQQGVQTAGDESPVFVTYSLELTEGDLADLSPDDLPDMTVDAWSADVDGGRGSARPLQVIGTFDCTEGGVATAGVGAEEPLVACQAFLVTGDVDVATVTLVDVGTWSVDAGS